MTDTLPSVRVNGRSTYTWRLPHGFIADSGGPAFDLEPSENRQRWLQGLTSSPRRWVMPKQQHGNTVLTQFRVSPLLENRCDGLASDDFNLGLAVFGSDCPGLILVTPFSFAIAHCGWRGIAAGIVSKSVMALTRLGANRKDIIAFIGPGICQSCYEVDAAVLDAFEWPTEALAPARRADRQHLDLTHSISAQLAAQGIEQILVSGICTSCDPDLHSHRHQGSGVVQVLAVHRE